ncbi:MAG: hypothetical protein D6679_05995, partial [Candidatus Hydrogenedentota bacterium]
MSKLFCSSSLLLIFVPLLLTLAAPAGATSVSLTQPPLSPATLTPADPDTAVLAFTITGAATDTLTGCTVTFSGLTLPSDFDTVALYIDANRDGIYSPATDVFLTNLVSVGGGLYSSGLLSYVMPSGSDSFLVIVNISDTAVSGDSFQSGIDINQVTTAVGGAGPGSAQFLPGFWIISVPSGGGGMVVKFTDATYSAPPGYISPDTGFIQLVDSSANMNAGLTETATVTVTNLFTGETETVILTEINVNADTFQGSFPISDLPADSIPQNGFLYAVGGDVIQVDRSAGLAIDTTTISSGGGPTVTFTDSTFAPAFSYSTPDTGYLEIIDPAA